MLWMDNFPPVVDICANVCILYLVNYIEPPMKPIRIAKARLKGRGEALKLGIELCEKEGADLLVATDPDADRVGIAVRDKNGELRLMSGNAVGVLLLNYIATALIEKGKMPKNPVAVKSIVTTALAERVCESFASKMAMPSFSTLVGISHFSNILPDSSK